MAKIYKKVSYSERDSRIPNNLTESELDKGKVILENFITYFKQKHLS